MSVIWLSTLTIYDSLYFCHSFVCVCNLMNSLSLHCPWLTVTLFFYGYREVSDCWTSYWVLFSSPERSSTKVVQIMPLVFSIIGSTVTFDLFLRWATQLGPSGPSCLIDVVTMGTVSACKHNLPAYLYT